MLLYNSRKIIIGNNCFDRLKSVFQAENVSFKKITTYGCGGSAKRVFYPKNIIEAKLVFDYVKSYKYVVLGNGSNVLASNKNYEGFVLSTKRMSGIIRFGKDVIFCLAGTTVSSILNYCKRKGFSGIEYLVGIPATIGGLAFMNGGVGENYVQNNVVGVLVYDGKMRYLSAVKCNFSYKYSTMRDINALILGVFLKIERSSVEKIESATNYFKNKRKHLPKGRSCGCVFKNVGSISAGKIIEEAGLKGFCIGGAMVSSDHANFIISTDGNALNVKKVIEFVKNTVREKFNLNLIEEVIYIGDFNDFNG